MIWAFFGQDRAMDTSVSLLILAAGLGSRFGSDKQILQIPPLGLPIFAFSLQDVLKNGVTHAVIVTRFELADFFETNIFPRFPAVHFDIIFQDLAGPELPRNRIKPWGTGHAVLCAREYIRGNFVVINADDFYGADAIKAAINFVKKSGAECCCIGYPLVRTLSAGGPVSRGIIEVDSENYVTAITEITQIQRLADGSIISLDSSKNFDPALLWPRRFVSLNLFGLGGDIFIILNQKFHLFLQKNQNSLTAEFYLPEAIAGPDVLGVGVAMKMLPTRGYWFGVTYREDLFLAEKRLREFVRRGLYA
ncbi:MAG: NTP transferase domain-containing protein [Puniceicoccales bacterium]|jgi:NDP-sugar pyrophosphorylase family protein|nr:NTP transferase domain-containing protein [Puniceicoccales bacterium]